MSSSSSSFTPNVTNFLLYSLPFDPGPPNEDDAGDSMTLVARGGSSLYIVVLGVLLLGQSGEGESLPPILTAGMGSWCDAISSGKSRLGRVPRTKLIRTWVSQKINKGRNAMHNRIIPPSPLSKTRAKHR